MDKDEQQLNNENNLENESQDDNLSTEDMVQLTPQQYAALLDKVNELEEAQKLGKGKTYSLEDLAEEGKGRGKEPQQVQPSKNLDDMSRTELAQFIINVVGSHYTPIAEDLQVQIQTIKVAQEIDRAAAKYPDFWDIHEDILRIGTENPSLSIDKAYKLAKAERGESVSDKKSTKDKTLLTLPPKPVLGEKPNTPKRSQTNPTVMTLEEAAEKAWADSGAEDK